MKYSLVISCVLIFGAHAQLDINEDDVKKVLDELPPELKGLGDIQLNDTQVQKTELLLSQKCAKNNHPEAVQQIKDSKEAMQTCVTKILDMPKIQAEIEAAKTTGSMDEVFGKYCKLYPELRACTEEAENHIKSCLDAKEAVAFAASMDAVQEIKEFLCYKDGDRMAMFTAEGGPECIQEQLEAIQGCVNDTFHDRLPDDMSADTLPAFLFSQQDCSDFDVVGQCIVQTMEKCKTNTPANIIDAFFKFLKKNTPCKKTESTQQLKSIEGSQSSAAYNVGGCFALFAAAAYMTRLF